MQTFLLKSTGVKNQKNGKFLAKCAIVIIFLPFDTIHSCSFASFMPNTGCKHLGSPFLLCAIHVFQILLYYLNVVYSFLIAPCL